MPPCWPSASALPPRPHPRKPHRPPRRRRPRPPPRSSRHTAQWIAWEKDNLAQVNIRAEELARRLDALGTTPEQRAPDTRSADVKLLDHHFPVAKPEEFLIRYGEPGQVAPPMTKELQQFDTTARAWLNQAEFPASIGTALVSAITKTAQATKHLSADQLESYGLLQYERLERVYGAELEDKLNAAGRMVEELEKSNRGSRICFGRKASGIMLRLPRC